MTRKVMTINEKCLHLECIKDDSDKVNPYRLYLVWWDQGNHRRLIAKYADMNSILYAVLQVATNTI